jgi:hypothetical protein
VVAAGRMIKANSVSGYLDNALAFGLYTNTKGIVRVGVD